MFFSTLAIKGAAERVFGRGYRRSGSGERSPATVCVGLPASAWGFQHLA
jgi:hypothetical protein